MNRKQVLLQSVNVLVAELNELHAISTVDILMSDRLAETHK